MLHALLAAAALSLIPVHGVVLDALPTGDAIVRTDAVPLTLPPLIRRYQLTPHVRLEGGVSIDAYLDRSTTPWTLRKAAPAPAFAPGLPDRGRVVPIDVNASLPEAE